jgi:hypothetical protein
MDGFQVALILALGVCAAVAVWLILFVAVPFLGIIVGSFAVL